MPQKNKIKWGQFFTHKNIFFLPGFLSWWEAIPFDKKEVVLEPFAGSNNIIKSLQAAGLVKQYQSYDIDPKEKSVLIRDTFADFPSGFSCAITNPPYLSKSSSRRKKIIVDFPSPYQDIYEVALHKCLEKVEYVAAIIPESFLTSGRLKERLHSVISLTYVDMFVETEHPVCLALFVPEQTTDFLIYQNDQFLGSFKSLYGVREKIVPSLLESNVGIKFNISTGNIHLLAVDNHENAEAIYFSTKNLVAPEEIKISSRTRTRIQVKLNGVVVNDSKVLKRIADCANKILSRYRLATFDVFMTSFKGLRKDGRYRRRLDFATAKYILNKAVAQTKHKD